ncbi:MAG: HIRAN domain-containing protein [Hyphomonadaceae bacterium]
MEIRIDGPGTFAVDVVGVSRRQDTLAAIVERHRRSGRTVTVDAMLVLEDSNPHDANAVRVEIDGELIGYLSRDNARRFRADLAAAGQPRASVRCKARIVGGFETASGERAHLGVRLDLPELAP